MYRSLRTLSVLRNVVSFLFIILYLIPNVTQAQFVIIFLSCAYWNPLGYLRWFAYHTLPSTAIQYANTDGRIFIYPAFFLSCAACSKIVLLCGWKDDNRRTSYSVWKWTSNGVSVNTAIMFRERCRSGNVIGEGRKWATPILNILTSCVLYVQVWFFVCDTGLESW
jgi:hypothetical protein